MSKGQEGYLRPAEMVSYLCHSQQPAILVEGSDDKRVYRYVEEKLSDLDVDVLVCEGRAALLSVYDRRAEFSRLPVVFVADRDMWYFVGIPETYRERVVFTTGYSIENDLYIRELFEGLMSQAERNEYQRLIQHLAQWQAFHVETFKATGACACDSHIGQICDDVGLRREYLAQIGYVDPPPEFVASILADYEQAIRGKTLFQALVRILSSTKRPSKYSRENLFELGAKSTNPRISGLLDRTRAAFAM